MKKRNLFIADVIWERMRVFAESSGMSIAEVIRRAILEFLRREEGE